MRALLTEIEAVPALRRFGRVARFEGLLVEVTGAAGAISLGGEVRLTASNSKQISCEGAGFQDDRGLPIDAFARPADSERAWPRGMSRPPRRDRPAPTQARSRGRGELDLGLARRVAVKATPEESGLLRRQAAHVARGIAEQLQDQGLHVLLLMDNVTRFTMAQRGLSAGEPARRLPRGTNVDVDAARFIRSSKRFRPARRPSAPLLAEGYAALNHVVGAGMGKGKTP
jgi:flagellar biosynthesis/type III secretory pathway ATPase